MSNPANMVVKAFFDPDTYTVTYLVTDSATKSTAIIDPVLDYDPKSGRTDTKSADEVIAYAKAQGLNIEWILETHVHADHITAAPYIKENLGGKIAIGAKVPLVQEAFKDLFNEGSSTPEKVTELDL